MATTAASQASTLNPEVQLEGGDPYSGLPESEAKSRLSSVGFNELPNTQHQSILKILLRVLQEPMLLLLVACGAIYLISGESSEGVLLFGSAVFVVMLTLYQEVKSERALEALRDLSSPRALVIRDGVVKRIPGREVVPGDLIQISEGDRVPADAVLISTRHLAVDESILTGESFSVTKNEMPNFRPGIGELPSQVFRLLSGTLVVAGQGQAIVYATGQKTELGGIGRSLGEAREELTPLQRELGRLARVFGALGIVSSLAVAVVYGLTRGDWLKGVLAGLAAAMSLLPEEFPVVLTVFMALGAWRLARKNVLTRRVAAIEALGATSALCVDKTGTLTQNQMKVRKFWRQDEELDLQLTGSMHQNRFGHLAEIAAMACNPSPFDPMEKAILKAAEQVQPQSTGGAQTLVHQYPLSAGLTAMSCVWKVAGQNALIVASKGSPEAILSLCHLSKQQARAILEHVHRLASQGMRVLAVAEASYAESRLPESQRDFDFTLLGLLALEDPIRPDVPASIEKCKRAGIRVIMLTGDYPETARSIANQLSLPAADVMSGSELSQIDDLSLRQKIKVVSVYARVAPDQKLRIITALKSNGERVAMTGDGVNDAPSLKWADIGVAMGGRGTDVARESSDIVLLDDSFTSMVSAIHQGRRIYDNLQKAILFILAVHVPIAGLAILPVLLKLPLLLMPAHIVFLELIIDPACSLVYEVEDDEADLMDRPPRSADASIVQFQGFIRTMIQGGIILILVLGFYFGLLRDGRSDGEARAAAFVSFVLSNLALILVNRSKTGHFISILKHKNKAFNWIGIGALVLLSLVLLIPGMRSLFAFDPIQAGDLALALAIGVLSLVLVNTVRRRT